MDAVEDSKGHRVGKRPRTRAAMRVVPVYGHDALRAFTRAWQDLAANAIEPNLFYEPWIALPALETFGDRKVEFVLVFAQGSENVPARLCAMFPLERSVRLGAWTRPGMRSWTYPGCGLCAPLIRRGYARDSLNALLDWLQAKRISAIDFAPLGAGGAVAAALNDSLGSRPRLSSWIARINGEGAARCGAPARDRVEAALRSERRMRELGALQYDLLDRNGAVEHWLEDLFAFEPRTAAREREFFRYAIVEAHRRGRAVISTLRHNGRLVAAQCVFMTDRGAHPVKTALDPAYAVRSPTLLLELHRLRMMREGRIPGGGDCGRAQCLQRVVIGTRGLAAGVVAIMPFLHWLHGRIGASA